VQSLLGKASPALINFLDFESSENWFDINEFVKPIGEFVYLILFNDWEVAKVRDFVMDLTFPEVWLLNGVVFYSLNLL